MSKVGNKDIEGNGECGRLQSVILVLDQKKTFNTDFCCSERVMVSKCEFQVRSELTQVQGSYKASKYCGKYFNIHPHTSVGPAGACKKSRIIDKKSLGVKLKSLKFKKMEISNRLK